jgi:hypothetical protein
MAYSSNLTIQSSTSNVYIVSSGINLQGPSAVQYGKLSLTAANTTIASLNVPHGAAPTTPANGDIWTTSTGLFAQIASGTNQFANITYAASNTTMYSTFAQNTYVNTELAKYTNTANMNTALALKANSASPTFTGNAVFANAYFANAVSFANTITVNGYATINSYAVVQANGVGHSSELDIISEQSGAQLWLQGNAASIFSISMNLGSSTKGEIYWDSGAGDLNFEAYNSSFNIAAFNTLALSGGDRITLNHAGAQKLTTNTAGIDVTGVLSTTGGITSGGRIDTAASGTGSASLRLPHGTAPTTPANGDMWTTTSGLYVQVNNSTVGPLAPAGGAPVASSVTFSATGNVASTNVQAAIAELDSEKADATAFAATYAANSYVNTQLGLKANLTGGNSFTGNQYLSNDLQVDGVVVVNSPTGDTTTYFKAGNYYNFLDFYASQGGGTMTKHASIQTGAFGINVQSNGRQQYTVGVTDVLTIDTSGISVTAGNISTTGTVTGSNLSGTNTGDQTITLTGDATGSGTGSFAVTVGKINGVALSGLATGILKNTTTTGVPSIAVAGDFPTLNQNTTGSAATLTTSRNFSISGGGITASTVGFNGSAAVVLNASVDAGHITLARMADVATSTVFYRKTAGTGAPEVQTLATLKTDLGLTGTNSGDQDLSSYATTSSVTSGLAAKADLAGDTFTGRINAVATAAGFASLRLPHGTAPSSPANGDMWTTASGLFYQVASATHQSANMTYAASNSTVYSTFAQNTAVYSTFAQNTAVQSSLGLKLDALNSTGTGNATFSNVAASGTSFTIAGEQAVWVVSDLTSDFTGTSTSLEDTGMALTSGSFATNSNYEISGIFYIKSSSAGNNTNLSILWPTISSGAQGAIGIHPMSDPQRSTGGQFSTAGSVTTANTALPTTFVPMTISGVLSIGASAPTTDLKIQIKNAVGAATHTVGKGSFIKMRKIN